MKATLLALALLLALASPVRADASLESTVAAAYFPRTTSTHLHDIAHQRAVEIVTDWSHNGIRPGTAEVLAWNSGYDPATSLNRAVAQWQGSAPHHAILSNPDYRRIGCAAYAPDERTFYVCVLDFGEPEPAPTPAPAPPPAPTPMTPVTPMAPVVTPAPAVTLPDTAVALGEGFEPPTRRATTCRSTTELPE